MSGSIAVPPWNHASQHVEEDLYPAHTLFEQVADSVRPVRQQNLWRSSVAGLSLGLIVGIAGKAAVVSGPLSNVAGLTLFAVNPAALLAIAALILMIAFLAGTLPTARAAKKDPIEALRHE